MNTFDPDFGKTGFARHLFRLRSRHLKLSQRAFADRFGLTYSVVRDAEQGARLTPALRLIVAAIADDPDRMETIARLAERPLSVRSDPRPHVLRAPVSYIRTLVFRSATGQKKGMVI